MLLFAFADGLAHVDRRSRHPRPVDRRSDLCRRCGMLDVDKVRGAVANSVAPATGTALGAVLAGLMVHYLPAPRTLSISSWLRSLSRK